MKGILAAMSLVLATALAFASTAEARGRCDGVHGCRCGVTAARRHGLPLDYNGYNLKQAVQWKRAFPQTSAAPGMVVYQHGLGPTGHVATIESMTDRCTALVSDETGRYERDICKGGAVVVDPHGSAAQASPMAPPARGRGRTVSYASQNIDLRGAY